MQIAWEPTPGEVYDGKVVSVVNFGAFVEIRKGVQGLLHISEIVPRRLNSVTELIKEGDTVKVKCVQIEGNGKIRLSAKHLNDFK